MYIMLEDDRPQIQVIKESDGLIWSEMPLRTKFACPICSTSVTIDFDPVYVEWDEKPMKLEQ